MDILLVLLDYLLPVIGSVLAILLAALAKKLLDKWGIERTEKLDAMLDDYTGKGVSYAEASARKYLAATGSKMGGGDKKAKAIRVVMNELEQAGVTGIAEELISSRIESWLEVKGHNPGVPSPE